MKCEYVVSMDEPPDEIFDFRSAVGGLIEDCFEGMRLAGSTGKRGKIGGISLAFGEIPVVFQKRSDQEAENS
jgi:hypothetical protein